MSRLLPCDGECNIPDDYLGQQRQLIDHNLREFMVRAIIRRNERYGVETTREEAEDQFRRHFLESGMEYAEAKQIYQTMTARD